MGAPTPPHGFTTRLRDVAVLTRRNVKRIARTPQLLAASSLQPVLFVLLFRYVFGGAIHTAGMSYVDYMIPAALLTTTLFAATTAVAMASDMQGGMIDRFRSLPIARVAVLAARAIADLLRSSLVVAIVLALGFALGFAFHNGAGAAIGAIALVLAFGFAFIWIFALIGMQVQEPQTAQLVGMLPLFPLLFASSAFVPVNTMPGWLQDFANVQPVGVTVNAARALAQGGEVAHWLWPSLAWIAGILIITIPLAVRRYNRT
ncbi:MAG: ABC transporter permease [Actinobacteria bacterium]|nr:ABC transporter permease [Actinomycetota bacterium]